MNPTTTEARLQSVLHSPRLKKLDPEHKTADAAGAYHRLQREGDLSSDCAAFGFMRPLWSNLFSCRIDSSAVEIDDAAVCVAANTR